MQNCFWKWKKIHGTNPSPKNLKLSNVLEHKQKHITLLKNNLNFSQANSMGKTTLKIIGCIHLILLLSLYNIAKCAIKYLWNLKILGLQYPHNLVYYSYSDIKFSNYEKWGDLKSVNIINFCSYRVRLVLVSNINLKY